MNHAKFDVGRWGGKPEDYIAIHEVMDSSKMAVSDNRHRFLTHQSWFVCNILPRIFGHQIINSSGRAVNVKDIGEYHCLDDFRKKFVPTAQDYASAMFLKPWMNSGLGIPPSMNNILPGKLEGRISYKNGEIYREANLIGLYSNGKITMTTKVTLDEMAEILVRIQHSSEKELEKVGIID